MTNLLPSCRPCRSICLVVCVLAVVAQPAADVAADEPRQPVKAGEGTDAAGRSILDMIGGLSKLADVVGDAGISLEGLIKPETLGWGTEAKISRNEVEVSDNEIGVLSENEFELFNGNSASAVIHLFSGTTIHLTVNLQVPAQEKTPEARTKPAARTGLQRRRRPTTADFESLDLDGDRRLGFHEYRQVDARSAKRRLRRRFRRLDRDWSDDLSPQEFLAAGQRKERNAAVLR